MIILQFLLLLVGFVILIKGADYLVRGASSVAKKFGISNIVIGLTIVAFGTSAPELIVNVMASIRGSGEIVMGNVVGSNIANILLILGISAMIYPLVVKKGTVRIEIPFALLAFLVLDVLVNDVIIDKGVANFVTRIDGIIMILFFIVFLYYTFSISKTEGESENVEKLSTLKSILFIIGGIFALTLGGDFVVRSATNIAMYWGVSESLIALTIVSIGTSLPELATSVVAALKKNSDIAIGNVIGSNIFNILWVLGLSAIIRPVLFNSVLNVDVLFGTFITILVFIYMFVGKKNVIQRWQGASLVFLYVGYIVYLVIRG
ncbi:MAG: calcium/sodium antiporter [Patescibacteria group bacterium]|nr:calcium/sodium antiporter [Patescibacteria group bacterium]MDD4304727.1 calcium/sodium antiporter [Patescibacteria group bacterium]MDD4695518.1 calcium/sodium antiporter [Patescibacteria group bacterium]